MNKKQCLFHGRVQIVTSASKRSFCVVEMDREPWASFVGDVRDSEGEARQDAARWLEQRGFYHPATHDFSEAEMTAASDAAAQQSTIQPQGVVKSARFTPNRETTPVGGPFRIEALVRGFNGGFLIDAYSSLVESIDPFAALVADPKRIMKALKQRTIARDFTSLRILERENGDGGLGRTIHEETFDLPWQLPEEQRKPGEDDEYASDYGGYFRAPSNHSHALLAEIRPPAGQVGEGGVQDVLSYCYGLLSAIEEPSQRTTDLIWTLEEMYLKYRDRARKLARAA